MSLSAFFGFLWIIPSNICYFLHFPPCLSYSFFIYFYLSQGVRMKFWQFLQLIQELSHPNSLGIYLELLTIKIHPGPFLFCVSPCHRSTETTTQGKLSPCGALQHAIISKCSQIPNRTWNHSSRINLDWNSLITLRAKHHLLVTWDSEMGGRHLVNWRVLTNTGCISSWGIFSFRVDFLWLREEWVANIPSFQKTISEVPETWGSQKDWSASKFYQGQTPKGKTQGLVPPSSFSQGSSRTDTATWEEAPSLLHKSPIPIKSHGLGKGRGIFCPYFSQAGRGAAGAL